MIAFHYPPYGGGTGVHRTLKFTRYLPEFGWQPVVLTASPRAYVRIDNAAEIPPDVIVNRAFALDAARHLSIRGRHLQLTALPDRWATWWPAAVWQGLALIKQHKPRLIWSTYPIATAHAIALTLQRLSGLPWIADFRDPMSTAEPLGQSGDRATNRARARVERRAVNACTRAVFTTPSTAALYASRFPEVPRDRWTIIANGYDEEDFEGTERLPAFDASVKPFVLVHSGDLYPGEGSGRDPTPFFKALAALLAAGKVSPSTLRVVLRATSDDVFYRGVIKELGIDQLVFVEPPISHQAAVREMLEAHGLLLLQGKKFNRQVPAKAYEYLRSRRPIFAVTDSDGDTAALLRTEGVGPQARADSVDDIAARLMSFIATATEAPVANYGLPAHHSRRARTQELAALMDSVVAG